MNKKKRNTLEIDDLVVKFVGDSGDGMQLVGGFFTDEFAFDGHNIATFPDFPAEIRAPQNTLAGVSGFQVRLGAESISTPGDKCDVLVAMNPASLRANMKWLKPGATVIVNQDTFEDKNIEKAGYKSNPLYDGSLSTYNLIMAPVDILTHESLKELGVDAKTIDKSRNMCALGIIYFIFGRNPEATFGFIDKKFKKKPELANINKIVLKAGYHFADTIEALESTFQVPKAKLEKGRYRNISGNTATAWGLLAASERSGRPLFLGSYPITPATEILVELAKHKSLGVKVFQAEDEIAGICSAIGASYSGAMGVTTTSGPGLSLKTEALGLAVITELPLVIIDVQRAGPSTGMPTKSEQSDLYQALFGRNGECPLVVIAASSPVDCFYMAYQAAKIAMEHMTPVILLSEGYIGNGSQLFKIPAVASLPTINPPIAQPNDPNYKPYLRDENYVRKWALPGTEGLRHRVGGLEKENIKGAVTTDAANHELMVHLREAKVQKVAESIPEQDIKGEEKGDLLVVSWGSTEGQVAAAVNLLQMQGKKIAQAHFKYIYPMPKNTAKVLAGYKKIVVCELNAGQFVNYLRMQQPDFKYSQFNKVQGLPFTVSELVDKFKSIMEETKA
jgi:2-oxoglutarate/2-oxoacid ferredoxin oxidoreductase subunit alpha